MGRGKSFLSPRAPKEGGSKCKTTLLQHQSNDEEGASEAI